MRPLTAKQTTRSWTQMQRKTSISLSLTKLNVTFHAKTYTNGFVFNGLSHWVAVGNPLKAFTKPLEVLGKPLCFFHYPLKVLKKAVGNCFPSRWKCWKIAVWIIPLIRWNNSFDPLECWSRTLDTLDQVAVRNLSSEGHCLLSWHHVALRLQKHARRLCPFIA